MRRSAIVGAVLTVGTVLGVLTPVTGSTAAWADGPRYVSSTMTFDFVFPAGTICDFDFHNVFSFTDRTAIFPDKMIDHLVMSATGEVLKFTPHINPSDAAVLCTALGGHPAS